MKLPKLDPRAVAGGGIFGLTLLVFAMMFAKPELADNDLFKMLAQAVVAQGLIGLAMAYYFTSQHRPTASGKPDDPVHTVEEQDDA